MAQVELGKGKVDKAEEWTETRPFFRKVEDSVDNHESLPRLRWICIRDRGSVGGGGDSVNDVITYTFDVILDGNVTLTIVEVSDPLSVIYAISCVPVHW